MRIIPSQKIGTVIPMFASAVIVLSRHPPRRTAQMISTLDGLGAVGSKMHSPDEYLEVSSLRERAALLALFMETWYEQF